MQASSEAEAILDIRQVSKSYGGVQALNQCSFTVHTGRIMGLIGPNGSGKTTLFNVVTGLTRCDIGSIYFRGEEITGEKAHRITLKGLSRTFQGMRLFWKLSVLDNLMAAGLERRRPDMARRAREILDFVGLGRFAKVPATNLSFGQQRLLQFAISLMSEAQLILLDEPTAGVNPKMIENLLGLIRIMREREGRTFLIVEHNMYVIMNLCDHIVVMDEGHTLAEGSPAQIEKDRRVVDAYLGRKR